MGVLLDILKAIDSENEATISKIIMLANIPYERLKKYLEKLLAEGYIQELSEDDRKCYKLTLKGYRLINELEGIKGIFDKLGFPL